MAFCGGGCAKRREAIKRVSRAIIDAVRPAKAASPVVEPKADNAGRRLVTFGLKRRK